MPNWKKVVVSGSSADLTSVKAGSYFIPPTGSGSVPAKSYVIPFLDTASSVGNFDKMFKDNQNKLFWFPAGGLNVIGNITIGQHTDGTAGFLTASHIIASGPLTGSRARLNSIPIGSTETRILVSDTSGNVRYRTNLSLTGPTGPKGQKIQN